MVTVRYRARVGSPFRATKPGLSFWRNIIRIVWTNIYVEPASTLPCAMCINVELTMLQVVALIVRCSLRLRSQ